jgi:hypothetical protein
MVVRRFSEVDLREMMEDARDFTPDVEPGRRVIATTWSGTPWEIVVEPDVDTNRLVIVTAYMVE